MAPSNLDLVRSIYAAWERGDYGSAEWAHPEIEFVTADGPSPGSWRGFAGLAEGARSWVTAWEEFRIDADQYRVIDAERTLVVHDYTGRGKTSGLELGQIRSKGATLFHVRGGKVTRLVQYWDAERALADLGLEE
jgi:ketosteroid isomerase-like protein